ncbi:VOC family protein [Mitsuokella sp. AF33-22]|nr:VOC family protein [Mitsuokella sp. AF33-22]
MKFKNIDHIVITTQDLKACLHFYVDILGMELEQRNGRNGSHLEY